MSAFSLREFGSLDHEYPIIEVYDAEELVWEIVTSDGADSIEVISSHPERLVEGATIEHLMKLVLPQWRAALQARDAARGR